MLIIGAPLAFYVTEVKTRVKENRSETENRGDFQRGIRSQRMAQSQRSRR